MVAANCFEEYGLVSRDILTCNVILSFHILLSYSFEEFVAHPELNEKPIFMDILSNYPMYIAPLHKKLREKPPKILFQ